MARRKFRIIFVNQRHMNVGEWEVPPDTDISDAAVIMYYGKPYAFQYIIAGENAAQYMETRILTVEEQIK